MVCVCDWAWDRSSRKSLVLEDAGLCPSSPVYSGPPGGVGSTSAGSPGPLIPKPGGLGEIAIFGLGAEYLQTSGERPLRTSLAARSSHLGAGARASAGGLGQISQELRGPASCLAAEGPRRAPCLRGHQLGQVGGHRAQRVWQLSPELQWPLPWVLLDRDRGARRADEYLPRASVSLPGYRPQSTHLGGQVYASKRVIEKVDKSPSTRRIAEYPQSRSIQTLRMENTTGGLPCERRNAVCIDRVDQVFIQTAYLKTNISLAMPVPPSPY